MVIELHKYQIDHTYKLLNILQNKSTALDASDTGTGKTYTAIKVCEFLSLRPFIICPKAVINNWISVCKDNETELFGIANYELIKGGNYYTEKLEKTRCPYMDSDNYTEKQKKFIFYLPSNILLIFDEAHRCKNYKTATSRLLLAAKKSNNKILLLSATITDKIKCFIPFGIIFGFYKELIGYKLWIQNQINIKKQYFNLGGDELILRIIHSSIFPHYGSRMKISELGNQFPQNNIISQCCHLDNYDEVDKLYLEINKALLELKNKELKLQASGKIIRARQKIEMLKVPIFLDLYQEAKDSGFSVVIFVNFRATMNYLCNRLKCDCIINGDQNLEMRQNCIDEFQSNKKKLIICMIQAGATGISLHDVQSGKNPRISLISPTWNAIDLKQCLGRIYRSGGTNCIQKIVYVANTYEDKICEIISEKLKNISLINDDKVEDNNIFDSSKNEKIDC
jgi:superfamily II DNA or RNA helicase